tara:strand:+ start:813 stop:1436 length:624 start_codon:yes stop_codon:yes gene_type:complete
MIKAVLFDFDDTLVPYREIGIKAHQAAAKRLKIKIPTDDQLKGMFGMPWDKLIHSFWPGYSKTKFKNAYWKVAGKQKRKAFPGAVELIKKLGTSYKLFILSSREKESLHTLIGNSGFKEEMFEAIYSCEEVKHQKPDERFFEPVLTNYTPNELVYVGDTIHDAVAAKSAGMKFIGIANGGCTTEAFEKIGADWVIKDIKEFPNLSKK